MSSDNDALLALYNRDLMALSSEVAVPKKLAAADARATAQSAICGSEVTIELALDGDKISEIGYTIDACTLTKAVVAIMARVAKGKSRAEIAHTAKELQAMLEGAAPPPSGDWAALKILEPVIEYKARHDTVMLPFVAVDKAFSEQA
jgi:NifU-like protein involved in Fe-S cluster formation